MNWVPSLRKSLGISAIWVTWSDIVTVGVCLIGTGQAIVRERERRLKDRGGYICEGLSCENLGIENDVGIEAGVDL